MQIIVTSEEDKEAVERLTSVIEKAILSPSDNDKWYLTKDEITKKLGWSESTIKKKISAGLLTPIRDSNTQNAKVRFYIKEVIANIPDSLRKKYGSP